MIDETKRLDEAIALAYAAGASRERRRIRRLQAKHLKEVANGTGNCTCRFLGMISEKPPCPACRHGAAVKAIDAATRAPKKARTK